MNYFKNIEQVKALDTEDKCREYLEQARWSGVPKCSFCNSENVTRVKRGNRFQCNEKLCRKSFSVIVGTIYENTKMPLLKWVKATILLSEGEISTLGLSKKLKITNKTATHVRKRLDGTEKIKPVVADWVKSDLHLRLMVERDRHAKLLKALDAIIEMREGDIYDLTLMLINSSSEF